MKLIALLSIVLCLLLGCVSAPRQPDASAYQYHYYYDGRHDDLLTAGMGLSGLRAAMPPTSNLSQPTAGELRRGAYYHNFKALNDLSSTGGYGRLYGIAENQPAISGHEYWASRQLESGASHTVVLQVPDAFNRDQPCLVAAPSSGSRHVLGAVGTSGAWGLMRKCAVVYTDKGTGTSVQLHGDQRLYDINGQYLDAPPNPTSFSQQKQTVKDLTIAMQHAHSQHNPEAFWGLFVLDSIRYAQAVMQHEQGISVTDLTVIAASLSNGGGAVIRAAEQDTEQLIDAVVAAEPQIYVGVQEKPNLVQFRQDQVHTLTAKPLLEYTLESALYEPCAVLDESLHAVPFAFNLLPMKPWLQTRCEMLHAKQLLSSSVPEQWPAEAREYLLSQGMTEDALQLLALNTFANLSAAIGTTYANSYARSDAADALCDVVFAHFDSNGQAAQLSDQTLKSMFALSSGIAPTAGIELAVSVADENVQRLSLQPGYGLDAMFCLHKLWNDGMALRSGVHATLADPALNSKPTIILHGRSDATVHVNHASRAYFARHQQLHGNQQLRYYEITQVQHFDAFLAYPGFNQQFIPMHPYFEQALDMMWAHVVENHDLPPSQVVHTQSRGMRQNQVPALEKMHIPPIVENPKARLQFLNNTLVVPN
ncbi:3-hydroxybutyrate oligomer hydrolase family protein [Marinicella sp. W31]|uniref:3-hydroxybutyrate oligomer hydrolase family protein n=1 Tax=Marinicella sp. W31 TaxID=3023713 RepID=UPI003756C87C